MRVVLDTNIVLDLFVFSDSTTPALREALQSGQLQWMATQPMRDEMERVLAYAHIIARLQFYQIDAQDVLDRCGALVHMAEVAPKARYACKDADDQKFIDLAVAHQAMLVSKDKAVLTMAKRLRSLGVETVSRFTVLPEAPHLMG